MVRVETEAITVTMAGLRGVALTSMVVVKVLSGNVLPARAVGMAVGTVVGTAVGIDVGMVVETDAGTVRGIVVVVIRRPREALAVRTIVERAVRIRDGIGSRDIAVGVLLIIILVTPLFTTPNRHEKRRESRRPHRNGSIPGGRP